MGRIWWGVILFKQLNWIILFVLWSLWLLLDKTCRFSLHVHLIFYGIFLWVRDLSQVRLFTCWGRPGAKNDIQTGWLYKVEQSIENWLKVFILRSIHLLDLFLKFQKLLANVSLVNVRSKLKSLLFSLNFFPVDIWEPWIVFDFLEIAKPHFRIRIQ